MPEFEQLFPEFVVTECCRIKEVNFELCLEEKLLIQNAVAKRQNEFSAGRLCARRALNRLGIKKCKLIKRPDGSASWPDGISGAISHNDTWCGAAVASNNYVMGIGFDIETIERMSTAFAKKILAEEEEKWVTASHDKELKKWVALMFSAKESVYKCLFPIFKKRIGYKDAVITPDTNNNSFIVAINNRISAHIPSCSILTGRYILHEGNIFTGVVLKR
jgi:phosphopantetheine--protein transferase-like protein